VGLESLYNYMPFVESRKIMGLESLYNYMPFVQNREINGIGVFIQ
jgi:hypothetical protein